MLTNGQKLGGQAQKTHKIGEQAQTGPKNWQTCYMVLQILTDNVTLHIIIGGHVQLARKIGRQVKKD